MNSLGRMIFLREMFIESMAKNKKYLLSNIKDALDRYFELKLKKDKYDILQSMIDSIELDTNSDDKNISSNEDVLKSSLADVNSDKGTVLKYADELKNSINKIKKEHKDEDKLKQRKLKKLFADQTKRLKLTPDETLEYEDLKYFFHDILEYDASKEDICNNDIYECLKNSLAKAKAFVAKEKNKYTTITSTIKELYDRSSASSDLTKTDKTVNYITKKILEVKDPSFSTSITIDDSTLKETLKMFVSRIPSEFSFTKFENDDIKNIHPANFALFTPEQFQQLTQEQFNNLEKTQLAKISEDAWKIMIDKIVSIKKTSDVNLDKYLLIDEVVFYENLAPDVLEQFFKKKPDLFFKNKQLLKKIGHEIKIQDNEILKDNAQRIYDFLVAEEQANLTVADIVYILKLNPIPDGMFSLFARPEYLSHSELKKIDFFKAGTTDLIASVNTINKFIDKQPSLNFFDVNQIRILLKNEIQFTINQLRGLDANKVKEIEWQDLFENVSDKYIENIFESLGPQMAFVKLNTQQPPNVSKGGADVQEDTKFRKLYKVIFGNPNILKYVKQKDAQYIAEDLYAHEQTFVETILARQTEYKSILDKEKFDTVIKIINGEEIDTQKKKIKAQLTKIIDFAKRTLEIVNSEIKKFNQQNKLKQEYESHLSKFEELKNLLNAEGGDSDELTHEELSLLQKIKGLKGLEDTKIPVITKLINLVGFKTKFDELFNELNNIFDELNNKNIEKKLKTIFELSIKCLHYLENIDKELFDKLINDNKSNIDILSKADITNKINELAELAEISDDDIKKIINASLNIKDSDIKEVTKYADKLFTLANQTENAFQDVVKSKRLEDINEYLKSLDNKFAEFISECIKKHREAKEAAAEQKRAAAKEKEKRLEEEKAAADAIAAKEAAEEEKKLAAAHFPAHTAVVPTQIDSDVKINPSSISEDSRNNSKQLVNKSISTEHDIPQQLSHGPLTDIFIRPIVEGIQETAGTIEKHEIPFIDNGVENIGKFITDSNREAVKAGVKFANTVTGVGENMTKHFENWVINPFLKQLPKGRSGGKKPAKSIEKKSSIPLMIQQGGGLDAQEEKPKLPETSLISTSQKDDFEQIKDKIDSWISLYDNILEIANKNLNTYKKLITDYSTNIESINSEVASLHEDFIIIKDVKKPMHDREGKIDTFNKTIDSLKKHITNILNLNKSSKDILKKIFEDDKDYKFNLKKINDIILSSLKDDKNIKKLLTDNEYAIYKNILLLKDTKYRELKQASTKIDELYANIKDDVVKSMNQSIDNIKRYMINILKRVSHRSSDDSHHEVNQSVLLDIDRYIHDLSSSSGKFSNSSIKVNMQNDIEAIKNGLEAFIKDINEKLKTLIVKIKHRNKSAISSVVDAEGSQTPSIYKTIWNQYVDNLNDPEIITEEAQDRLYTQYKSHHLDPAVELAITRDDKIIFIVITFILRQISLAITEAMIDNGWITNLFWALISYIGFYVGIVLIIILVVNLDEYKMRIVFNFFNMHINSTGISLHVIMLIGFIFLMNFLLYNMNKELVYDNKKSITEVEKMKLAYKLELMTIAVFIFVSVITYILL